MSPAEPDPVEEEIELVGGVGNQGNVHLVGGAVRRPSTVAAPGIHRFLEHLATSGFTSAPKFIGTDDAGRDVMTFVEGDAVCDPHPGFVATERSLIAAVGLQRQLHVAARRFEWPSEVPTALPYLPSGCEGPLVCHNDLCVDNFVFADGLPVGVIDFDYAAPVDRLFDIAYFARHWAPFRPPEDRSDPWQTADPFTRFATICDIHQLAADDRERVLQIAVRFLEGVVEVIRDRAQANIGGFRAMWLAGYAESNRRSRMWLADHTREFLNARP